MLLLFAASFAQNQKVPPPPPPVKPSQPVPPPPPPKVETVKFKPPVLSKSAKENNAFYKRNPSVANIRWKGNDRVIIKLKKGTIEEYDLNNEEEKKSFTDKYGIPPLPPPPPPPTPPLAPIKED